MKTITHRKDDHSVSMKKSPKEVKIFAGLNKIIFCKIRFFFVTRSVCQNYQVTRSLATLQLALRIMKLIKRLKLANKNGKTLCFHCSKCFTNSFIYIHHACNRKLILQSMHALQRKTGLLIKTKLQGYSVTVQSILYVWVCGSFPELQYHAVQ